MCALQVFLRVGHEADIEAKNGPAAHGLGRSATTRSTGRETMHHMRACVRVLHMSVTETPRHVRPVPRIHRMSRALC